MEFAVSAPLAAPPASSRSELAALLRLSAPLVGSNLLQMAIAAVDVIVVARLGPLDLAAATLGTFLFNLLAYAIIGLTGASAPLMAAELGRRMHAVREVRRSFRMAAWIGLLGSVPVVLLLWQGKALFRAAGQDAEVAARAGGFLRLLLIGLPLTVLAGVMRNAAAALGRPGWTFLITVAALLLDIVANWAFVFGHLGVPAMGLDGSALANVVSFAAMALAFWMVLRFDRKLRRYRLFGRWWRFDRARAWDIVRLGLPIMA
ncbi:MAG: MATE family efflux transporter, partial [Sphingomonadales bacterium]